MSETALIEGYASLFNVEDLNGDVVAPGAFRKALKSRAAAEVRMLYQHAPEAPVGRWTSFSEDSRGLWARGELILSSPSARDVYELIAGGAIDGLSIGFKTVRAAAQRRGRRILEAELWEVSIVTFPMAPGARIARVGAPAAADRKVQGGMTLADALRGAALNLTA
jgi:hypothetical protein